MKLEAGQLIRLNRNKGTLKEGEIFNVIRTSGYLAVIKSTITKDKYFIYREFDGVDLVNEVFYV